MKVTKADIEDARQYVQQPPIGPGWTDHQLAMALETLWKRNAEFSYHDIYVQILEDHYCGHHKP